MISLGDGMTGTVLVYGWIRGLFKEIEFENSQIPPTEVMELIVSWYNEETVHWLRTGGSDEQNEHYSITLSEILSSLTEYNQS